MFLNVDAHTHYKNKKKKEKENVTIEEYLTIEIKNIIITLMVMVDKNLKSWLHHVLEEITG